MRGKKAIGLKKKKKKRNGEREREREKRINYEQVKRAYGKT